MTEQSQPTDVVVAEAVEEGYLSRWGQPVDGFVRRSEGVEVVVYKWPIDLVKTGVVAYSTSGITGVQRSGHLAEFLILLTSHRDGIANAVATLWAAALDKNVGRGTTIDVGDPLWDGTLMSSFLLTQQSLIPPIRIDDRTHVDIYRAIPLYATEMELKRREGLSALLALWQSARIPYWDPNRLDSLG